MNRPISAPTSVRGFPGDSSRDSLASASQRILSRNGTHRGSSEDVVLIGVIQETEHGEGRSFRRLRVLVVWLNGFNDVDRTGNNVEKSSPSDLFNEVGMLDNNGKLKLLEIVPVQTFPRRLRTLDSECDDQVVQTRTEIVYCISGDQSETVGGLS